MKNQGVIALQYLALIGLCGLHLACQPESTTSNGEVEPGSSKEDLSKSDAVPTIGEPSEALENDSLADLEGVRSSAGADEQLFEKLKELGMKEPATALKHLSNLPENPESLALVNQLAGVWFEREPEQLIRFSDEAKSEKYRREMRMAAVELSPPEKLDRMKEWVESWDESDPEKTSAREFLVTKLHPKGPDHVCGPECTH